MPPFRGAKMTVGPGHQPSARATMMRELDHRAKNILQVIASILVLEKNRAGSEEARAALTRASDRLQLMSQVQSMLYLTAENSEYVPMENYLKGLCEAVISGLCNETTPVAVEIVCDDFCWPPEMAGQIGMIVAEALVNACRHAFPAQEKPAVKLGLRAASGGMLRLEIADNGKGFDPGGVRKGVGSALLRAFAQTLDGHIEIVSQPERGTQLVVSFSAETVHRRL